jgi:ADP-ribose pyrophosphatase
MPIQIDFVDDQSSSTPSDKGFIRVRRFTLATRDEHGSVSAPYRYDIADRDAIDAVLMVLHAPREGAPQDPFVCLRTALRPPVAYRMRRGVPVPDARTEPVLWEMPAGLIEKDEHGPEAVLATAARETEEEVGYRLAPAQFHALGVPVYLSPGLIAEKLHVVRAEVDRSQPCRVTATEIVEAVSRVEWCPLSEALTRAADGVIEDCKTELALHRLSAWVRAGA